MRRSGAKSQGNSAEWSVGVSLMDGKGRRMKGDGHREQAETKEAVRGEPAHRAAGRESNAAQATQTHGAHNTRPKGDGRSSLYQQHQFSYTGQIQPELCCTPAATHARLQRWRAPTGGQPERAATPAGST